MKRHTGFERDVPLALSVFILWTTGVVIIPYMREGMSGPIGSVTAIYLALHLVTLVIAIKSLGSLFGYTGLSSRLLKRDAFLHLLLYLYVVVGVCASLYLFPR